MAGEKTRRTATCKSTKDGKSKSKPTEERWMKYVMVRLSEEEDGCSTIYDLCGWSKLGEE
jgi:hypothetical protein